MRKTGKAIQRETGKANQETTRKATQQATDLRTSKTQKKTPQQGSVKKIFIGAFSLTVYPKRNSAHEKFSLGISNTGIRQAVITSDAGNSAANIEACLLVNTSRNTNGTIRAKSLPAAMKPKTVPKFVKPPPATYDWQRVVRKGNERKKDNTRCFFCRKKGHIQRNCRKRIKCFECGRYGHKRNNCLYKRSKNLYNPAQRPKEDNSHQPPQPINPTMEPIRNRPPLGDIFCPTTQFLDDENEYLSRVGLIILISGSPSPGLPRLIATNLAAIYGGHQSDYVVNQATIAPYLITCPNTHIRDAIVQRGIHSIPSMRTQFTIHEWRPRFGMGHDPPTHQVWVKITGLPLQAWTVSQITAVMQKIGHPIQILPYGQAAGHYRDITALVATQNPNRIPMAYTYREGDYSARIDVLILSWRLAEPGYFPPPDRPQTRQNPPSHINTQQDNNQAAQHQHRSSSSSDDVASEPTVDLSSWSPRSHSAGPPPVLKWAAKSPQQLQLNQPKLGIPTIVVSGFPLDCTNFTGKQEFLRLFTRDLNQVVATADPTAHRNPAKIYPLMSISLLTTPSHIAITPLSTLRVVCVRNWEETQDKLINALRSSLPALEYGGNIKATVGMPADKSPTAHPIGCFNLMQANADDQAHKKTSPCHLTEAHVVQSCLPAQGPQTLFSPPASPSLQARISSPLQARNSPSLQARNSPSRSLLPHARPAYLLLQADIPSSSHRLPPTSSQNSPNNIDSSERYSEPFDGNEAHYGRPVSSNSPTPVCEQITPNLSPPLAPAKAQRAPQQATRRSRRLQARIQSSCIGPEIATKPKSRTLKMAFDIDSDTTPLDASKALQILQATGLEISEQVQQLIDEAVKRDQPSEIGDINAPSTPLHDLIPPLALPGEDLLL